MKKEEEYTLYKQHDENKITSNTFNKGLEKACGLAFWKS